MSDSFATVAELDDVSLRALLSGDDPQARLYAAWALGLRSRDQGASAARALLTSEPHAGVRRQLAVMLGGDVVSLRTLVELDPSDRVRETALRLLVQSWPQDQRRPLIDYVASVLEQDESEGVRLAAIDIAGEMQGVFSSDRLEPHLFDRDLRVRAATLEALMAAGADGARRIAEASFSWGDDERRAAWARLCGSYRPALVASARARDLAVGQRLELVRLAFDDEEVEYDEVAWLSERDRSLDEEVLRISRRGSLPQSFLLARASELRDFAAGAPYSAWRSAHILAARGHEGGTVEPALVASLADVRYGLSRCCEVEVEVDGESAECEADVAWLREGLARLAGERG